MKKVRCSTNDSLSEQYEQLGELEEHVALRRVCLRNRVPYPIYRSIVIMYMEAAWEACRTMWGAEMMRMRRLDCGEGMCLHHYQHCGLCRYVRSGPGEVERRIRLQAWCLASKDEQITL